ncbi:MAG: hypothetical protein PHQ12_11960 [Chthoniobacteraceae bacterium]|nr:hypothetical protein [Chthoniobacteraceae bacterium]
MKLLCYPFPPPPAPLPTFHPRCRIFSVAEMLGRVVALRANGESVAADEVVIAIEKLTGAKLTMRVVDLRGGAA